jgi:glycosyltransferase involved in cell wall biosynthesis
MLGDGPLFEKTKAMISSKKMDEKFNLVGWVTPEEVLEAFCDNDLLVLPSSSEGLSVVGVQALSMGLVMVLSNAGGNPELVWRGENGDLFQVGDIDELTRLLSLYVSDRNELTHAKTKSLEYAQFFSLDIIVDKYEKIFLSVQKK